VIKLILKIFQILFQRKPLSLPHPEEPQNPAQTVANTNKYTVISQWLINWQVPAEYHEYWYGKIAIMVYDTWPPEMLTMGIKADAPAATWQLGNIRYLASLASWFNPGVIAHEQAHNSYALLSEGDRAAFEAAYNAVKDTDPLIQLLYRTNTYGLTNVVEGHAEVYRYLGEQMPDSLKRYYPRLL
jgi:hypothetical protein